MASTPPSDDLGPAGRYYCPVCGDAVERLQLWQQPGTTRILIFCDVCADRRGYRDLPRRELTILTYAGFARFAARRLLASVREKELERRA
jgi:hypothetical protein